jgi:hypothetical protein
MLHDRIVQRSVVLHPVSGVKRSTLLELQRLCRRNVLPLLLLLLLRLIVIHFDLLHLFVELLVLQKRIIPLQELLPVNFAIEPSLLYLPPEAFVVDEVAALHLSQEGLLLI